MVALPVRCVALSAALAALASAGCNLIFGIEPGELASTSTSGTGGSGATSTGAGAGGTGGSGAAATGTGATTSAGGSGTSTTGSGGMTTTVSITDGLALLLHMDEPDWTAPASVIDASGNGNHGTVAGTALPTAGGKLGGAGLFDGGGWIVVPDSASLHPSTELTVAVWVYPTGLTDGTGGFPSPGIVSKRAGFESNVAFTLFLYEQSQAFVDIQADRFHSDAALTNDQWYHVAFVFNGNEEAAFRTRIYINGALDSVHSSDPELAPNVEDIQVGGLPGGGQPFVGELDELALWTRALSPDEITSVYETGIPR